MATIHMDTDTVRNVERQIGTEADNINSAIQNVASQVQSTVGSSWQGQSATEFQQQFDDLRNQLAQQIDRLREMKTALASEISQWEEMQARLG